jgi:hypothetical protein
VGVGPTTFGISKVKSHRFRYSCYSWGTYEGENMTFEENQSFVKRIINNIDIWTSRHINVKLV